jgi:membrane-associated phospholipid phosphatase
VTDGSTPTGTGWVRRRNDALSASAGLVVLILGMIVVRDSSVPGLEEDAFRVVNDLPGALYPVLWPFQQLGALLVGPAVAIGAAIARRFRLALMVLLATLGKLALERAVKATVTRRRPGTSIGPDIHLRGDVSTAGESFVTGHAVLVAAIAGVLSPYLPGRWKALPWTIVALVMITRVYVGAHNPLDVICGAGLGLVIAGCLNLIFGVPRQTGTACSSSTRSPTAS